MNALNTPTQRSPPGHSQIPRNESSTIYWVGKELQFGDTRSILNLQFSILAQSEPSICPTTNNPGNQTKPIVWLRDSAFLGLEVAGPSKETRLKKRVGPKRKMTEESIVQFTSGRILPDGRILDLISGDNPDLPLRLVACDGGSATVSDHFIGPTCTYRASKCDPALIRAIRLPSSCAGYGSTKKLFTSLATSLKDCLGVSVAEGWLLAAFCLSTWVADRLLVAPELEICAADQAQGIDLLRVLHSVCRHSLLLAELTKPDCVLCPRIWP